MIYWHGSGGGSIREYEGTFCKLVMICITTNADDRVVLPEIGSCNDTGEHWFGKV